jgi:hypothetical protein
MKKKKSSTKRINLGSGYINFLKAVDKYRHLPYPEYKKKIAQELGYIKK